MTYTMSTDYDALYDLLCGGGEAFCLVDYDWKDGSDPLRDAVRIRRREEWDIDCGVRGMSYGQVRRYQKLNGEFKDERLEMKAMCQRLNLEWLAPVDIAEVIKAGNELRQAAKERVPIINTESPSDMRLYSAFHNWTEATAKHRTT